MKKFTNKFYELYLAEISFTKKCRLLKKFFIIVNTHDQITKTVTVCLFIPLLWPTQKTYNIDIT